jgi:hypothetical protein
MFYEHFSDKEACFVALLAEANATMRDGPAPHATPRAVGDRGHRSTVMTERIADAGNGISLGCEHPARRHHDVQGRGWPGT